MFKKVTIVGGAGHVGLAFALICISKNINVHIHDTNKKALALIEKGVLPHKEKNGSKILNNNVIYLEKNFSFIKEMNFYEENLESICKSIHHFNLKDYMNLKY